MATVVLSTHPVLQHQLASLRDVRTGPAEFRRVVRRLATFLAIEATADLTTAPTEVLTPLGPCPARTLTDTVMLVPILRAGLGMVDGILDLIPEAEVRHLGLYRDEQTCLPVEYYCRLPTRPCASVALILDPMLATGGSVVRACQVLQAAGLPRIKVLAILAAPEGLSRLQAAISDVTVHIAQVDERLTSNNFIYPGLGDAGDRQFHTMPQPENPEP